MGQDTIQAIRDAEQKADQIEQQASVECSSLLAQARSQAKAETDEALAKARAEERLAQAREDRDITLAKAKLSRALNRISVAKKQD